MKYTKPALTVDQQILQLQGRGMAFGDRGLAAGYLREINYYRLRGYWLRRESDRRSHRFEPGTTFEGVLTDYVFDRELRLLVLDAVERLEVSIRTRFAHNLGLRYGSHAHLDGTIFKDRSQRWSHPRAVASLVAEVERRTEAFIQHIRKSYDEILPPLWVTVEVMTLGQVSLWFGNLRHGADRKAIGGDYGLDEVLLSSFLHHLTIVRNVCAHHGRLWDRRLPFQARLPRRNPAALVMSLNHKDMDCHYNTLTMLGWLVSRISPAASWVARVAHHIESHPPAKVLMGFPEDYQRRPVWQSLP